MKSGTTYVRGAEVHSVKNTGKTPVKVILVEVTRPAQTTAIDAATDATKVSPALYKVKADSLGIRVIDVNYKPGQSSPMHSHPEAALYVLDDGKAEFTSKDGNKDTIEFKKGMAMIRPAESHSVKNIGKTVLKAILVEVNRGK
jgi:quercetin dioxygenase-like cupin family protein